MLHKKFEESVAKTITEWVKREVPSANELEAAEAGYRMIELLRIIKKVNDRYDRE